MKPQSHREYEPVSKVLSPIEVHNDPQAALCDKDQALTPDQFVRLAR